MTTANHFDDVFRKLLKFGFLLESDPKLPSVCTLITGMPLKGSWWSHPLAQTIFQVNEKLEDHPDVLITKLVSGKVTFVHRGLWPELLAIGTSHEPWQTEALSGAARSLLKMVQAKGTLQTDQLVAAESQPIKIRKPGDIARELERTILVHAEPIHTASGAHAKLLETWEHWSKRKRLAQTSVRTDHAKTNMEERLRKLNDKFHGTGRLPWNTG